MLPSEYELNQLRLDILLALVQLVSGQGVPHEKVKEALFTCRFAVIQHSNALFAIA